MDVPISLGVVLALGMSIFQTLAHERIAYFDSALMLHDVPARRAAISTSACAGARATSRSTSRRSAPIAPSSCSRVAKRARRRSPRSDPGDLVLVRAGERVAVDGTVEDGRSEVDQSLVTGETAPIEVSPGAPVYAGTLNLTGALRVRVRNAASGTLLDEVNALLARAVEQRSSYVRLADRAARLYVPVVHAGGARDLSRLARARRGLAAAR